MGSWQGVKPFVMDARQFIDELKTRGVYRVAAFYCAGAWALLQVADLFFPMLGLPDESVTVVLIAAGAGFPFALLLSWRFDLTPEGVVSAPATTVPTHRGKLSLPHLLELLLIVALTLSVGYLYLDRLTPAEVQPPAVSNLIEAGDRPSIAVLPFLNLSTSEDLRYLGDGVAEEILNSLARLNELNVAARSSSFYFRDKDADFRMIANKLAVGHLLEGSVRREGSKVRVTAQLIETSNGFQVWSGSYDRSMSGLLALQEDIARQVVDSLQVVLSDQSDELLARDARVEPLAYDYYLRGRDYLRRQADESNLNAGIAFFRRALAIDREYVDAWAGLCDGLLGLYEATLSASVFSEGERACQEALGLDHAAVSVYVALGNLYRVSGEWQPALREFNRALELNPAAVDAYLGRGKTFAALNKPEQVERDMGNAITLQPSFWRAHNDLGAYYFETGDFSRAIPYFEQGTSLNPGSETAWNNLGSAYYMLGDFELAAEAWQHSVALAPSGVSLANLGGSLFFAGHFDQAAAKYEQAVILSPKNFEYWGYLAEARSFAAPQENTAAQAFERAADLAGERLAINPKDHLARAMMASYMARSGRLQEAANYLDDLLEQSERSMHELYYRALTFTAMGQNDDALDALELAVAIGYPSGLLVLDRNFTDLRLSPRFAALKDEAVPISNAAPRKEIVNEKY